MLEAKRGSGEVDSSCAVFLGTLVRAGGQHGRRKVTRAAMEKLGEPFAGPIWVEMKFNWSHAHSTPELVKVHGGKLGDTYFVLRPRNYKVAWMARNEDFFALRWGVPDFIRRHIALNGGQDYVRGYFAGSESYIPALDYFTAVKEPVDWKWAFQRSGCSTSCGDACSTTGIRPMRSSSPSSTAGKASKAITVQGVLARVVDPAATGLALRLAMGFHALQ